MYIFRLLIILYVVCIYVSMSMCIDIYLYKIVLMNFVEEVCWLNPLLLNLTQAQPIGHYTLLI